MRNFIKNHTPEWWDGWCWFTLGMIVWCLGWAVFDTNPVARGFQAGMAVLFIWLLVERADNWHRDHLVRTYRDICDIKDTIIRHQRSTLIIKNETIKVQQDHIDHLQEQRAAR